MADARHILYVTEFYHPDICASAVVAADHLSGFARMRPDWRITVITGNRAWQDPGVVHAPRETHRGVSILRVNRPALKRTHLLRRAWGFAAFGRSALRGVSGVERVDLVVGTTAPPQGGMIARSIAARMGCPYVYKVLDLYPDLAVTLGRVREASFLHRRWLAADTRAMEEAAAVVCIADRMRDRLLRTRAFPPDRIHAIHDGYDASKLSVPDLNPFLGPFNPDGKFVVQYAGNMGLSHPFDAILAAALALAHEPDILFQFVGDGPHRPMLAANLPPNARLIDFQPADRLGSVLAAADLCLISQHDEMFDKALPYKIYAILAAGRPTVFLGNADSEIAAWLRAAGAGLALPQTDPTALAEAIVELKNDEPRRSAMGAAAARWFEERFKSDVAVGRWVELIERVLRTADGQ